MSEPAVSNATAETVSPLHAFDERQVVPPSEVTSTEPPSPTAAALLSSKASTFKSLLYRAETWAFHDDAAVVV
jgi:hypothetical protein